MKVYHDVSMEKVDLKGNDKSEKVSWRILFLMRRRRSRWDNDDVVTGGTMDSIGFRWLWFIRATHFLSIAATRNLAHDYV